MQSLINLSLLKLSDHFHIFFADGIIFKVIKFGGIVGKVEEIDSAFMFFIEFVYVFFKIEIEATL